MPEGSTGSTVPRRRLGRELRGLRVANKLRQKDVVEQLGWSQSKLVRVEAGEVPVVANDVDGLCRLYGTDDGMTEALLSLARLTKAKGWWHSYGAEIPDWFELFVDLEASAVRLREYHTELISGVFQTRAYATAVFRKNIAEVTNDEVERRVEVRLQRARILDRLDPEPPRFDVVLNEAVIRRPIGGRQVMAEQLRHLAELTALPNVSIRVLPFSAGLHGGAVTGGSFTLLDFAAGDGPTVVYTEGLTGALYLDQESEIYRYTWAYDDLSGVSLDEATSRRLLLATAEEYER